MESNQISSHALLTPGEVCERLCVSTPTLYRLMENGELPYIKIGRCRRIRREDVEALIQRNTVGAK